MPRATWNIREATVFVHWARLSAEGYKIVSRPMGKNLDRLLGLILPECCNFGSLNSIKRINDNKAVTTQINILMMICMLGAPEEWLVGQILDIHSNNGPILIK